VSQEPSPAVNGSLVKQAQRALERNQVGNAIALAQQATQQSPGNADAWWMLGACYDAAGQRGQARVAYQRCASLSGPVSTECKALLGR
jgi:Flp pilus assembly protein TadD